MTQLIKLAQDCPNLILQVTMADLHEFGAELIARTRAELEQMITDQNAETYPSREKVMQLLSVSESTLWRWAKSGYLVPLNIGGKRRYRMSDVKKILNQN